MRTREEIEKRAKLDGTPLTLEKEIPLELEVLLDIRDLIMNRLPAQMEILEHSVYKNEPVDLGEGNHCGSCNKRYCFCPERHHRITIEDNIPKE